LLLADALSNEPPSRGQLQGIVLYEVAYQDVRVEGRRTMMVPSGVTDPISFVPGSACTNARTSAGTVVPRPPVVRPDQPRNRSSTSRPAGSRNLARYAGFKYPARPMST